MVEFALILPLMVLIIAGLFDLGRAFFDFITITNAAREGARYGALHPKYYNSDQSSVPACLHTAYLCIRQTVIDETVGTFVDLTSTDGSITISCPDVDSDNTCDGGQSLIVTVGYNYNNMIFKFFFPTGIPLESRVEMFVP